MPATLRIDLDNNTGEGFGDLESQLREAAGATEELNATAKAMSRTVDLSEESIKALSTSFAGLVDETRQVETGMEKAARETTAFRTITENLSATIEILSSGMAVLIRGVVTHRAEIAAAAKITQEATQTFSLYGAGIRATIGYVTGLGAAVTGAYIATKGFEEILDRTGKKFVDVDTGLENTSAEFLNFAHGARNAGVSVEQFVDRTGKSFDDFRVKAVSNLDRINEAGKRLAADLGQSFVDFGVMVNENLSKPIARFTEGVWKDFDASVTRGANQIVSDVEKMRGVWKSYRIAADAVFTDGDFERARTQEEVLDRAAAATKRLAEINERNRPDYAAIRAYNEQLRLTAEWEEKIAAIRGKAPIGGLQRPDYGKEQAEIDRLRNEELARRNQAAQEGRLEDRKDGEGNVTLKGYREEHEALMKIINDREAALKARREEDDRQGIERIIKQQEEQKKALDQQIHDQVEASRKAWEERQKIEEEARSKAQKEEEKAIADRIDLYRYEQKERQKLDAEAARAAEVNRQRALENMMRSFSGGPTARDTQGQAIDIERRTQEQIARLRQQQIQQYVSGDVKGFFESERQKYDILNQSLQAQKQLRDKFLKEASPVEQIKAQITDKDLAAQIEKDRLDKLRADRAKNRPDPFANDDVVDPKEERQRARYDRETRRQEQNARRQLRRDMQRGNVGEDEVNQATNNLVKATVDRAQQEGKVGAQQAEAMNKVVEIEKQRLEQDQQREAEAKALTEALEEVRGQLEELGVSQRSRAMRR